MSASTWCPCTAAIALNVSVDQNGKHRVAKASVRCDLSKNKECISVSCRNVFLSANFFRLICDLPTRRRRQQQQQQQQQQL
jgi:hypothetical protein